MVRRGECSDVPKADLTSAFAVCRKSKRNSANKKPGVKSRAFLSQLASNAPDFPVNCSLTGWFFAARRTL